MTRTLDNVVPGQGGAFFSLSAQNIEAKESVSSQTITATQRVTSQNVTVNEGITAQEATVEGKITAGEIKVDSIEATTITVDDLRGVYLGEGTYYEAQHEGGLLQFSYQGGTPVIREGSPIEISFRIGRVGNLCVARMINGTARFDVESSQDPLCIEFDIPEDFRPPQDMLIPFFYREHPDNDLDNVNTRMGMAYLTNITGYVDGEMISYPRLIFGPDSGYGHSYSVFPPGTYSIPRQSFSWVTV